ncbi:MAG: tripartite tricarboxylate transporter permease [Gammaproteobacteria bacterium]|nr:tripartite tricarboxylate transporter permease [Gammaproteobacteria bacterium]MBT7372288.1 tripartite tricarboxylate transporter permease [Gammaproteobacteria bacterium]
MIDGVLLGLTTALTLQNLTLVLIGCAVGTLIGMLPGLGPISAIALMIPVTYGFEPSSGMILLAGVYYGAIFGGSTSSILINAPGVAGTVATAFDGYPMARGGEPGKALATAAWASFTGGTLAAVLLLLAAPWLADLALSFQSVDYFLMMVLGLSLVTAFAAEGEHLKATLMTFAGLALATVGTDLTAGVQRFTFGRMDLVDGISFVLLAMGTFALSEAIMMALFKSRKMDAPKVPRTGLKLSLRDFRTILPTLSRSSILGFLVGILPGAGATIASFLAYGVEKKLAGSATPAFGEGNIKGLAAPETANNAACTGSFVPLLTLGIPGSGTTAVLLGALIAYGIQPGPRLYVDEPQVFWGVIVSMYIGNLFLLMLNLPLIPYLARMLAIPRHFLIPLIMFFSMMGVYLVSFNPFDLQLMVFVAVCAVILRLLSFPMAPLLLGFILGGMLEDNLRRAITVSDGELGFFLDRPVTLLLVTLIVVILISPLIQRFTTLKSSPTSH